MPRPRPRRTLPARRRVERLATELPQGVHDPAFLELLHRIDQSPILPARRLEVFTDGNRALVEMIDAIDRAGEEVLLQSYIFKDDSTGHAVVDALGKAVERGVRVRVLADAVGSVETREEFWQRLEKKRIAFRLFHPLRYPWLVLFRDHRKILVIDRAVAFTGGMNIAEEYGSGLTRHRASAALRSPAPRGETTTWRDTHLRVEGPAAWEFAVVFRESWLAADGPPFDLPSLTEPQAEWGARCLVLDSRSGRGHRETALVLRAAVAHIAGDQLSPAFKMLARVSRIMEQLVHAWDVLATMTPPEYSAIRPYLKASSGFQSWQYRCIEFMMGNKNPAMLKPHAHRADRLDVVEQAWRAPSLYDESLRLLARRGLPVPASHRQRDWTQPYRVDDSVERAWLQVYREPQAHWELYQLGEELVDLEDAFRLWRFRHVTTVERVIGFKRGTGGTTGVSYLRKMLDVVLFPELWRLRTDL